ncbi:MAG: hypothetical protein LUE22_00015 [Oscillospiraceae bacterium]|nr:hypothetical protein [Oscillospiraceae bacterium]
MAVQAKRPALTWGELLRRRPKLKAVLTRGGYFILGLATGAGRLFGSCGPFGFAAVGASGFGLDGFCALWGQTLDICCLEPFWWGFDISLPRF